MNHHIGTKATADSGFRANRVRRRPSSRSCLRVFVSGLPAAGLALFAASSTAEAATPSASLSIAPVSVSAGTQPVITYITSGIPAKASIYLQLASGSGQQWHYVGRVHADSGSVKAPADPAGKWRYRILVAQGDMTVATSAPITITVTASGGQAANSSAASKGAGCTACTIAKAALPWLEPIVAPVVGPVIGSVIQTVGQALLDFFGWLIAF